MASQQVAGAQAKGVYAFMKHFALNDQETNRLSELATWANEQSIREIYLKPFEMSVKQGVVPEFLRTLVFARPRGDDQFADCTFSPSLDMSR